MVNLGYGRSEAHAAIAKATAALGERAAVDALIRTALQSSRACDRAKSGSDTRWLPSTCALIMATPDIVLKVRRMERRLAAILAADVVGYSRFMAADEAGTIKP